MPQPGPSDYRGHMGDVGQEDQSDGIMDQLSETARDIGGRAGTIAEEVVDAVRERPYTTLALAAGLAFAVGAIWKLGQRPEPSRLDRLMARLPDLPSRDRLERWWR